MATKTIPDVELVATGTWKASTGETTITRADLEAMLNARDDVDHAPLKLGHRSALNAELGDGAPAYGWVVPTRIENRNGRDVLIGDLKDVPAKLADAMHSAYRRRSAEIAWKLTGLSGKAHKAALVGLALLGVAPPAVKGLADALSFHSTDDVDAEDVSHVTWLAEAPDFDGTLREPTVPDQGDTPALNNHADAVVNDGPMTEKEAAVPADPKGQSLNQRLAEIEDADLRKMVEDALAKQDTAETAPAAEAPAPAATDKAEGGEATAPAPALVGAGTVQLSEAVYAEMQRELQWARDKRRSEVLDGAVTRGAISPAERAHFSAMLDRDEEGTTTLLSSLGTRYPVTELGADQAPTSDDLSDEAIQAYINRPAF